MNYPENGVSDGCIALRCWTPALRPGGVLLTDVVKLSEVDWLKVWAVQLQQGASGISLLFLVSFLLVVFWHGPQRVFVQSLLSCLVELCEDANISLLQQRNAVMMCSCLANLYANFGYVECLVTSFSS